MGHRLYDQAVATSSRHDLLCQSTDFCGQPRAVGEVVGGSASRFSDLHSTIGVETNEVETHWQCVIDGES